MGFQKQREEPRWGAKRSEREWRRDRIHLVYDVRVSDKADYVSPTRGQMGNALKRAG
jgi:hypothetical protein